MFTKFSFPASPNGTTASSGSNAFVDNTNDIWTVSGSGSVLENGALAGNTSNVSIILWWNNLIYYEDNNSNWFVNDLGTVNWRLLPGGDPRGSQGSQAFLLDYSQSKDSMYVNTVTF